MQLVLESVKKSVVGFLSPNKSVVGFLSKSLSSRVTDRVTRVCSLERPDAGPTPQPPPCLPPLPRVIIIGTQGDGKSSVAEHISKHEIFPRDDERATTRCPLVLRLKKSGEGVSREYSIQDPHERRTIPDKALIKAFVEEMMQKIPPTEIRVEPIIVEIPHPTLIVDIELVDLPGIRFDKPITTELVEKYLTPDDNNEPLVLCVVPISVQLVTNQAACLLTTKKMRRNAILVLTKADRYANQTADIRRLVRMLKKETEETADFAGVVAVINREFTVDTHKEDIRTLDEQDNYELKWFDEHLLQLHEFSDNSNKLRELCGVEALLIHLTGLIDQRVKTEWPTPATRFFAAKIAYFEKKLADLGRIDNFDEVTEHIRKYFIALRGELSTLPLVLHEPTPAEERPAFSSVLCRIHRFHQLETWVRETLKLLADESNALWSQLSDLVCNYETIDAAVPLKLFRFVQLKNVIVALVRKEYLHNLEEQTGRIFDFLSDSLTKDFLDVAANPLTIQQALHDLLLLRVVLPVFLAVDNDHPKASILSFTREHYVEQPEDAEKRKHLSHCLQEARQTLAETAQQLGIATSAFDVSTPPLAPPS
jgi:hypothetical protein